MNEVPSGDAAAELELAHETLRAAEVLRAAGLHRHAVGRAYYAVFHAACSLLARIGRHARTHEGVRGLVNEHFVRPGLLAHEHARTLRQTAGDRNDADYDARATFTASDAEDDVRRARAFLEAVEAILAADGQGPGDGSAPAP
ncbi:MAG: HEPN domain-containing protein [Polyangiaceae bacterium]|nr:HEPN domain-containing protein [Polyangiaceae bacterium]